jgi:hypothetical protein
MNIQSLTSSQDEGNTHKNIHHGALHQIGPPKQILQVTHVNAHE